MRMAWISIASGAILFEVGNLLYLFHDQNLAPMPFPASSDVPYLLSYAMFILGVGQFARRAMGPAHLILRLDALLLGLAVAALAATMWFGNVLTLSGSPLAAATGIAYPISDLMLIVLLISTRVPERYEMRRATGLLVFGFAWFVIGDIVYLNQNSAGAYVAGGLLDGTWVIGIFILGIAACVPERARTAAPADPGQAPKGLALVPIVASTASIVVLADALFARASMTASLLAIGALSVCTVRMALTFHDLRNSTEHFHEARTDELTGLANRRAFMEQVESMFDTAAPNHPVGVLLIDLDGFKDVNDSIGHHAGDMMLQNVGERFRTRVGRRGFLARIGGDEFACAFLIAGMEPLLAIAAELSTALADPIAIDGIAMRVGASIGAAISPNHGSTALELLRSADVAMYEAKRSQFDVVSYNSKYDLHTRDRLELINELREAVDSRRLTLHYQPTFDLHTNAVRGVEALVRWDHPTRGLLYPDSFLPLAERVGLIPQLTRAVLEQAIAEAAHLAAFGHPLQMNVNITRHDLINKSFSDYLDKLLAQYDFPREMLTLEITEQSLSEDPKRAERAIHELRERGIRIALDDFGVGYSSMSQLLGLPIDELKIDKSFILALETDYRAAAIISSTVELARALNLSVVAEGVELAVNLQKVRLLGADIVQGYHISYPLSSTELGTYLNPRVEQDDPSDQCDQRDPTKLDHLHVAPV